MKISLFRNRAIKVAVIVLARTAAGTISFERHHRVWALRRLQYQIDVFLSQWKKRGSSTPASHEAFRVRRAHLKMKFELLNRPPQLKFATTISRLLSPLALRMQAQMIDRHLAAESLKVILGDLKSQFFYPDLLLWTLARGDRVDEMIGDLRERYGGRSSVNRTRLHTTDVRRAVPYSTSCFRSLVTLQRSHG